MFTADFILTFAATISGLLAALIGLVGAAYTFMMTEKGKSIDRLFDGLLADVMALFTSLEDDGENKIIDVNISSDLSELKPIIDKYIEDKNSFEYQNVLKGIETLNPLILEQMKVSAFFKKVGLFSCFILSLALFGMPLSNFLIGIDGVIFVWVLLTATLACIYLIGFLFYKMSAGSSVYSISRK